MKQIKITVFEDGRSTTDISTLTFDSENLTTEVTIDYSNVDYADWVKQADIFVGQNKTVDYKFEASEDLVFFLGEEHLKAGYLRIQPIAKELQEDTTYKKIKWQTVELKVRSSLNVLESDVSVTQSVAENLQGQIDEVILDITSLEETKVDKVTGKQLSTEDYTSAEKTKVANVPSDTNSSLGLKANKAQEAWITPTLLNGWSSAVSGFHDVGYMKDEMGFVHLRGRITNGTINVDIFLLPVGYRPSATIHLPIGATSATQIFIYGGGTLRILAGSVSNVSLNGVYFQAEQ